MLLSLKQRVGLFIGMCIGLPLLLCLFPLLVYNSGLLQILECRADRQALQTALDRASSVQVFERNDMLWVGDGGNIKETVVSLTPKQIAELRNFVPLSWGPLMWDSRKLRSFFGLRVTYATSKDHHRIEITQDDGTKVDLTIDFKNGYLCMSQFNKNTREYEFKDIGTMPSGNASPLRGFISSLGMHPDGPWPEDSMFQEIPK